MSKRSATSSFTQPKSKLTDWDKIWKGPTPTKGITYLGLFTDYIHRNVVAAHPLIKTCTLQRVLGTGSYGYVFQCYIVKCDGTAITCAVKIKLCIKAEDVDYYNSALTAAKNHKVISQHLPIIEGLNDWYLCKELVAPGILQHIDGIPDGFGWPCGVIFMEMLPREITHATSLETEMANLCKLTQALCDATIYYPDLKTSNVMLRADDDTPILVDLDAILVYSNTFYDLELVASYFPFNMEHACYSLNNFQPDSEEDFNILAKYVTCVAGICTVMQTFFIVTFIQKNDPIPYNLSTIVSANHYSDKVTSYQSIKGLLERVDKDTRCDTMTCIPAYKNLTTYIKTVKVFSDAFGVHNKDLFSRFRNFYKCRASFADLTFCDKLYQTHK